MAICLSVVLPSFKGIKTLCLGTRLTNAIPPSRYEKPAGVQRNVSVRLTVGVFLYLRTMRRSLLSSRFLSMDRSSACSGIVKSSAFTTAANIDGYFNAMNK